MVSIKINGNNNEKIKVSIEHSCTKASPWGDGCDYAKHNKVKVVNCTTHKRCSFDYWGSVVEPNQESVRGAVDAISCYASDGGAFISSRDYFDFCSEFGYDDLKKARKAYSGCKKADNDLSRVIGDYDFLMEFGNFEVSELKEKGLVEVIK